MTRREDHQTTDPAGAATFERHHGIDPLPAAHGITTADVAFRMAGDDEHPADCWACAAMREARWAQ